MISQHHQLERGLHINAHWLHRGTAFEMTSKALSEASCQDVLLGALSKCGYFVTEVGGLAADEDG